jgi:hypothetical protein
LTLQAVCCVLQRQERSIQNTQRLQQEESSMNKVKESTNCINLQDTPIFMNIFQHKLDQIK